MLQPEQRPFISCDGGTSQTSKQDFWQHHLFWDQGIISAIDRLFSEASKQKSVSNKEVCHYRKTHAARHSQAEFNYRHCLLHSWHSQSIIIIKSRTLKQQASCIDPKETNTIKIAVN